MHKLALFTVTALLPAATLLPASAWAEDAPQKGAEGWDGSVELAASNATGNTQNSVLGARFEARRIYGRYTNDVEAGINYAESTTVDDDGDELDSVTQNNWFGEYKLNIHAADRTFYYGRARYEQDEFSGFESRAFLGAGVGHTVVDDDAMKWSVSAGPGVQYTMYEEPDPITADFEDSITELAVYAGSEFDWVIRDNVSFENDTDITWTDANTTAANTASLKTKLTESLSSRLSYMVKHETDPPTGRESTDTQLSASIVYGF